MKRFISLSIAAAGFALSASTAAPQAAPKPLENPCLVKEVLIDYYRAIHSDRGWFYSRGIPLGPFNEKLKTLDGMSCEHIYTLVAGLGKPVSPDVRSYELREEGIIINIDCDPATDLIQWTHLRVNKEE